MTPTQEAAMRQALEVLRKSRGRIVEQGGSGWKLHAQQCVNSINALSEALAEVKPDYSICPTCGGMAADPIVPVEARQKEPVAWANHCRVELVTAIHTLASAYENMLFALRDDAEALKAAKGDIAHAMSVAAQWNWNGGSAQQPMTDEHVTDGSQCWCDPELDYKDPDTGAEVWVHRGKQ